MDVLGSASVSACREKFSHIVWRRRSKCATDYSAHNYISCAYKGRDQVKQNLSRNYAINIYRKGTSWANERFTNPPRYEISVDVIIQFFLSQNIYKIYLKQVVGEVGFYLECHMQDIE